MYGGCTGRTRCFRCMKKFVIIANALKDRGLTQTRALCRYIRAQGADCRYLVSVDEKEGIQKVLWENIPSGTECILVLGGDGTLIRAARDTFLCGIPLLGINMGTLGYLCELEIGDARSAIDAIMRGDYVLEERMMLSGEHLYRKIKQDLPNDSSGVDVKEHKIASHALNDIVIHRAGALSLVSLTVYVNGQYLNTFQGDGIIIATPTGSTAYNMSAGGPIVDPKAQLLLLTPINAHTLMPKSIIIDAQDEIEVKVGSRRVQRDEMVEVSFDGDPVCSLEVGGSIKVRRAKACTKILKFNKVSFLEILRRKMEMGTG